INSLHFRSCPEALLRNPSLTGEALAADPRTAALVASSQNAATLAVDRLAMPAVLDPSVHSSVAHSIFANFDVLLLRVDGPLHGRNGVVLQRDELFVSLRDFVICE